MVTVRPAMNTLESVMAVVPSNVAPGTATKPAGMLVPRAVDSLSGAEPATDSAELLSETGASATGVACSPLEMACGALATTVGVDAELPAELVLSATGAASSSSVPPAVPLQPVLVESRARVDRAKNEILNFFIFFLHIFFASLAFRGFVPKCVGLHEITFYALQIPGRSQE